MMRREAAERKSLERVVPRVLRHFKAKNAAIGVFFLPAGEMRRLKRAYLGIDKRFVDVLAFPESEGFPGVPQKGKKYLGEVYLNRLLVRGSEVRLYRLFFHGILHILGFSHEGARDTIEMERLEDELLRKFSRK